MKASTLGFFAKYGASVADWFVLGHHADTSGSLPFTVEISKLSL